MTANQSVGFGCLVPSIGLALMIFFLTNGNVLTGILIIFISILLSIFLFSSLAVKDHILKEHEKYLLTFLPLDKDFKETQSFISSDALTRIAYDESGKRIGILAPIEKHVKLTTQTYKKMPYDVFLYDYSDLLAVEISENGFPIATATRRSSAARFLLEIDLRKEYEENFGKRATSQFIPERIETMVLKILVNDPAKPIHMIRFFGNQTTGVLHKFNSELKYRQHINEMRQWFVIMNNAMKDADKDGYHSAERKKTIPSVAGVLAHPSNAVVEEEVSSRMEEENSTTFDYLFYPDELEKEPEMEELIPSAVEELDRPAINAEEEETSTQIDYLFYPDELEKTPELEEPIKEDPFADFEEFLQRNKSKQFGHNNEKNK
ncbi:hypothetical protein [Bacillus sp. FJAT-50079]|uniref:hypothetical protein n=1 Tax=Bacillus sp. FJAT-50079 TaxID=2833577 RepID=UPI001BCA42D6|nr:hypothetical protein [Bacillus sp. FJAT-50079]MBS4206546.1 hypothetical protein [Bacillus sp. FJAT-50079]